MTQPLNLAEQRSLVKRWLDPSCDPRESFIGLLALIYACSIEELQGITLSNLEGNSIYITERSRGIELDAQSWQLRRDILIGERKFQEEQHVISFSFQENPIR
jgi:hypothetical protein